jgi:hypothetical protein
MSRLLQFRDHNDQPLLINMDTILLATPEERDGKKMTFIQIAPGIYRTVDRPFHDFLKLVGA